MTMTDKYYFINSQYRSEEDHDWEPMPFVSDKHPFVIILEMSKESKGDIWLVSWQEITNEQYYFYKENQDYFL